MHIQWNREPASSVAILLTIWALLATANPSRASEPARSGSRVPPAGTPRTTPTPEALEKWLSDKDVIEVVFAGPHIDPLKLRDSLTTQDNNTDFRLSAGEGGGENRAFVQIHMKVTPVNVRRTLSLQEELAPRGYVLDAEHARVWSYRGDVRTRDEARKLLPDVMVAMKRAMQQTLPGVELTREIPPGKYFLGGFEYQLPAANLRGSVSVRDLTMPTTGGSVDPDQTLHLPHLGMILTQTIASGRGAQAAQRQAVRQAFERTVEPLLKLEPTAGILLAPEASPKSDRK